MTDDSDDHRGNDGTPAGGDDDPTAADGAAARRVPLAELVYDEDRTRRRVRRAARVALLLGAAALLVMSVVALRRRARDAAERRRLEAQLARVNAAFNAPEQRRAGGQGLSTLLSPSRQAQLSPTERELLAAAPDPSGLPGPFRLVDVAVVDPSGALTFAEPWFPPRLRGEACDRQADVAKMPRLTASYAPGDADLIVREEPGSTPNEAGYEVDVSAYLLDSAEHRDAAAAVFAELAGTSVPDSCLGTQLVGPAVAVDVLPLGRRRAAFSRSGALLSGTTSIVSVGDRLVVIIDYRADPLRGPQRPVPPISEQEPVLAAIVRAFEASPLASA